MRNPLIKTIHREVIMQNKGEFTSFLEPCQLGMSVAGGAKLVHIVRMLLEENRDQENRSRDQEFRGQWKEREARDGEQRPCHFQERCWNTVCRFTHKDFTKDQEFLENY